jgi:transcription elongation factor GreA
MTAVWLTPEAHESLRAELAALRAADDPESAPVRAVRLRELQELLATAVVGEDPPNDGVAEPGMVLTVRYDNSDSDSDSDSGNNSGSDSDSEETFLLGFRGGESSDSALEVFSPSSPLGIALVGTRPGEWRSYRAPSGAMIGVTLVAAVPYGQHRAAAG